MSVPGTASWHDWEMKATGFSAETGLKIEDGSVSEIQYIKFSAPVSGLESGKNVRSGLVAGHVESKRR